VLRDAKGNLYGATTGGGPNGLGTIFKLDKTGKETVLFNFGSYGNLIHDSQGNLYGTTPNGGSHANGSVFKIDATGKETDLYSFTGIGGDGAEPKAALIRDGLGNLYGTTQIGGDLCASGTGCGTVFKVDTNGNETVLHRFSLTGNDGIQPVSALLRDKKGNLYGTTTLGGGISCEFLAGCGIVFKLDKSGNETVLYSFRGYLGGGDGALPAAGLISDSVRNFYGTTAYGGMGAGSVFKLDPSNRETELYSFCSPGGCQNGGVPLGALVRDAAGNLYGTTQIGGIGNSGTVFKLDPAGNETILHNFTGGTDGGNPEGSLTFDSNGNLYGTALTGGDLSCGSSGCGVVFRLTP
jgi:uncharacterized repeat protein (TIGR03803 family)